MPETPRSRPAADRRMLWIGALFVVQVAATLFFLVDAAADLRREGLHGHSAVEALVAAALVIGTAFAAREVVLGLGRQRRMDAQLRSASGAFAELLEEHFAEWRLTPSERDVAMLTIKGLSLAEIADMRGTATGTVKAQSNRIYAKAGVRGRSQLMALFVEELMAGTLAARTQAGGRG